MLSVKDFRELCHTYRCGVALTIELTGRSEAWLEGFFHAFDRVDELAAEFLADVEKPEVRLTKSRAVTIVNGWRRRFRRWLRRF